MLKSVILTLFVAPLAFITLSGVVVQEPRSKLSLYDNWEDDLAKEIKGQGYHHYRVERIGKMMEFLNRVPVNDTNSMEIQRLIYFVAQIHGIDPLMAVNTAYIESDALHRTNGCIVTSKKRAKGVMQIMLAHEGNYKLSVTNVQENVLMGVLIMVELMREFKTDVRSVAAYNCGPTRVRKWMKGKVKTLPRETRWHIRKYLKNKSQNRQTKERLVS